MVGVMVAILSGSRPHNSCNWSLTKQNFIQNRNIVRFLPLRSSLEAPPPYQSSSISLLIKLLQQTKKQCGKTSQKNVTALSFKIKCCKAETINCKQTSDQQNKQTQLFSHGGAYPYSWTSLYIKRSLFVPLS